MTNSASSPWLANVVPSLPKPPPRKPEIALGQGFVFTAGGLGHAIVQSDVESLISNLLSPPNPGDS